MRVSGRVAESLRGKVRILRSGLASARRVRPSALVNGAGAGVGVALIALAGEVLAPEHAASLMLGAICASVADTPAPLAEKLRRIGVGWLMGAIAVMLAHVAVGNPLFEAAVVMVVGFCAALITAWGRNAIAISVSVLLALVLSNSAGLQPAMTPLLAAAWFSSGGLCYALYAAVTTPLLQRQTKRMLLQEALHALADYLRAQKAALDIGADPASVYVKLVDLQATLAERIQAARNVIFVGLRQPADQQIAAELLVGIDILEAALSEQADLDTLLEMGNDGDEMLVALRGLLLIAASELDHLSRSVADPAWQDAAPIGDRRELLSRITAVPRNADSRRQSALQATADKVDVLFTHIERLREAQRNVGLGESVIGTIDLGPFVQRTIFDWRSLRRELTPQSPILRYAVRLSLAMACGSLIGSLMPYRAHGSWILLTVALVMRASYSVTRQRRNERLLGNVIGCVVAALALWIAPASFIPLFVFIAVASAHAFALQSYLVASVASCVMALLQIHIADPGENIFLLMRVVDTGIGAFIAYAFSFLLPHWEYQTIAKLVPDLLRAEVECARQALAVDASDQAYRLARRRLFDSIAALSTAVSRMLEEPSSSRTETRALSEMLAAAYVFAAELASVQVFLRSRADRTDPKLASAIFRARNAVEGKLTRASGAPAAPGTALTDVDSLDRETYEGAGRLARRLRRVIQVADRVGALTIEARGASPKTRVG